MKPFPTISPSGLSAFEKCPSQWYRTKILKEFPWVPTEAMTYGTVTHEYLEKYVKVGEVLPEHLVFIAPFIDGLKADGFKLYAEMECAVREDWVPVGWWDKSAWLRGKVDLIALNADTGHAIVIDYKTGKRWDDPTQLKIYGLMLYTVLGLKSVKSLYMWLKEAQDLPSLVKSLGKKEPFVLTDANAAEVKEEITARIAAMKEAYEKQLFPTRTSPLCGWCPCLDTCPEAVYYKVQRDRKRR